MSGAAVARMRRLTLRPTVSGQHGLGPEGTASASLSEPASESARFALPDPAEQSSVSWVHPTHLHPQ